MSGPRRLEREQNPTKVKRDCFPLFLVFVLVALGMGASLLFAHYGWTPVESFGP
jgi:hypothetical protein